MTTAGAFAGRRTSLRLPKVDTRLVVGLLLVALSVLHEYRYGGKVLCSWVSCSECHLLKIQGPQQARPACPQTLCSHRGAVLRSPLYPSKA